MRRDLELLEERHLLTRTHGGAAAAGLLLDLPLRYGAGSHRAVKQRIAAAAVERVTGEVTVVGFTGGTTTTEVARALADRPGLTIVTNALNIASELALRRNLKLFVTGGIARPSPTSSWGRSPKPRCAASTSTSSSSGSTASALAAGSRRTKRTTPTR